MTAMTSYHSTMPAKQSERLVLQLRHLDAEERQRWSVAAFAHGLNLTEFVREAVEEKIGRSGSVLKELSNDATSLVKKRGSK